jgi:hypothetical protein
METWPGSQISPLRVRPQGAMCNFTRIVLVPPDVLTDRISPKTSGRPWQNLPYRLCLSYSRLSAHPPVDNEACLWGSQMHYCATEKAVLSLSTPWSTHSLSVYRLHLAGSLCSFLPRIDSTTAGTIVFRASLNPPFLASRTCTSPVFVMTSKLSGLT